MKQFNIFIIIYLLFSINLKAQIDSSIFIKEQFKIIDSINFITYKNNTIITNKKSNQSFKMPDFNICDTSIYQKFKSFSKNQKIELLKHSNPSINLIGFILLLQETKSKEEIIYLINLIIYNNNNKRINIGCNDAWVDYLLDYYCLDIISEKKYNSIQLSKDEEAKLKIKINDKYKNNNY